jgi:hypothetical protein
MKQFQGVHPISGEDLSALPVKEIGLAVEFYTTVLRFSVVARDEDTATIQRDRSSTNPRRWLLRV